MDYRTLGASGCSVSVFALGTMTFGRETPRLEAFAQLNRFIEAGGNLVDTADIYVGGESETIIGQWLASRPELHDHVVLASKARFPVGPGPNQLGLSRKHLAASLEATLTRLGVDHVDLYQAHSYDPHTPLEETLRFADDAMRSGKIAYFGLSNFTGWQLQKAVHLARSGRVAPPVTLQVQYSLLNREIEWEIAPSAADAGVGLLPWSPLAGGWLSGKYRRDEQYAPATRLGDKLDFGAGAYGRRAHQERTWRVLEAVRAVAAPRGVSLAQVALAWLAARPTVTAVVLGARTCQQLDDDLAATDLRLSNEEVSLLDKASDPGAMDYPYGEPGQIQRSRKLGGGR